MKTASDKIRQTVKRLSTFEKRAFWVAVVVVVIFAGFIFAKQLELKTPMFARIAADVTSARSERIPVAVVPFGSVGFEATPDYLRLGLTRDVIGRLFDVSGLATKAFDSILPFYDQHRQAEKVGRHLGVHLVLSGEMDQSDEAAWLTVELTVVGARRPCWEAAYSRVEVVSGVALAEIALNVAAEAQVELRPEELRRLARPLGPSFEAYDYFLRAWALDHPVIKGDKGEPPAQELDYEAIQWQRKAFEHKLAKARRRYQRALEFDPGYARAYAGLAGTYLREWILGWSPRPESAERAGELAQKAVALDPELAAGHDLLAWVFLWRGELDEAAAAAEKTAALRPGDPDQLNTMAQVMCFLDEPEKAGTYIHMALHLNSIWPPRYLVTFGHALLLQGAYEAAYDILARAVRREVNCLAAQVFLVAAYEALGLDSFARNMVSAMVRIRPGVTLADWRQALPYRYEREREFILEALKKAGLK